MHEQRASFSEASDHLDTSHSEIAPPEDVTLDPEQPYANSLLADKLSPMITEERLAANALNYPEMRLELSSRDERQIAAIKDRLIGIPLVHASRDPDILTKARRDGLQPHASGIGDQGSTFPIDASLGLDEYTFCSWGRIDDTWYGQNVVVIDARTMLQNTLVTPQDITSRLYGGDIKPHRYQDLDDATKASIDEIYFSTMITGTDSLEIMARKVHQFAKRMPGYPYPIERYSPISEYKVHGTIDPTAILDGFVLPDDFLEKDRMMNKWNESLLQYGVAFDTAESTLERKRGMLSSRPEAAERFRQAGWNEIMEQD